MNKDSGATKVKDEQIVIVDECGDSMWDAVLAQDLKACDVTGVPATSASLPNSIIEAKVCDASKTE